MTENLISSEQDLFEEVVTKGLAEGVANQEAYNQLVSDVIEQHRRWGEQHDDNDLEGEEDRLQERWPEYEARLNERAV